MDLVDNESLENIIKNIERRLICHEQILTVNKRNILKILFSNNDHLTVDEIVNKSSDNENEQLDKTTVYRILSNFETFNIVESILLDDNKRRYELSYLKKPHYHLYCEVCHKISEFHSSDIHDMFLNKLKKIKFESSNFNVIINGVCEKC